MSEYIYGLHDAGGESHMGGNKGWIVWTQEIGVSGTGGGNYTHWSNQGYGVIVRLNHGYGAKGTLPVESQYDAFAARCADYVKNSAGVDFWIIGNECNMAREWPNNVDGHEDTGEAITVARYVSCYNKCHAAIKAQAPGAKLCPAPTGTWSPPYPHRGIEGFLEYWTRCLTQIGAGKIDGLILHAYTHGCAPALVFSTEKMTDDPYKAVHKHFFVYKDLMAAIPGDMRHKPVMITECDQLVECATGSSPRHAWKNENSGWVRNIYAEIDAWNAVNSQKIRCVALFRWEMATEGAYTFGIGDKAGVIADFQQAVAFGYTWGGAAGGEMVEGLPSGTNLARHAAVVTDSDFSPSYTGQKAVDGTIAHESKWTSANTSPPHWLRVDLGGLRTVTGFVVRHAESGGVDASHFNTQAFAIQSGPSFDGPWTTEVTVDNSAQAEETLRKYLTPKSMRYVRLLVTDPGPDNHARIVEFEVFGAGESGGMIDDVPAGTNIAPAAMQVATDSNHTPEFAGDKAIDGIVDQGRKWASAGTPPPHWLKLDLGANKSVTGFVVHHASAPPNGEGLDYNTEAFSIQSAPTFDGPWTDEVVVNNFLQAGVTRRKYAGSRSLRYVRLFITDPGRSDDHARIQEFEVYEEKKLRVVMDFETMPEWSSVHDAVWGGEAKFSLAAGGVEANCLRARRVNAGSSCKVKVLPISPNQEYTLYIWMRTPGSPTSYWAEFGYKLGESTAEAFDNGAGWVVLKGFNNLDAPNGTNDEWKRYTATIQTGNHSQISVGFKIGSEAETAPLVKWDALRIR